MGFWGSLGNSIWGNVEGEASGTLGNIAGGIVNPVDNLANMGGFINPNDTAQGKALEAQKGNLVSWGSTADAARAGLGTNINAPTMQLPNEMKAATNDTKVTNMQAATAAGSQAASAPQMTGAQLDLSQSNQAREGQGSLVSSLQGTAAGQGPSVAQEQLRQSTAANINNQQSAAQSMHGAARLAALRNAQFTGAATQQTANSQAAGLRAQEIAGAQTNLGNALGTMRSQDVGAASANAQLGQNTQQTNLGSSLQTNLLNAQLGQQTNLANAQFGQQTNATNAAAANTAALHDMTARNTADAAWANQINADALARAQANMGAQLQTNQLNTQRQQMLVGDLQGAAAGQTGIGTTQFQGTEDYDASKRKMVGDTMNSVGQAVSSNGGLGSIMSMI